MVWRFMQILWNIMKIKTWVMKKHCDSPFLSHRCWQDSFSWDTLTNKSNNGIQDVLLLAPQKFWNKIQCQKLRCFHNLSFVLFNECKFNVPIILKNSLQIHNANQLTGAYVMRAVNAKFLSHPIRKCFSKDQRKKKKRKKFRIHSILWNLMVSA